jgi:hypothetical protein
MSQGLWISQVIVEAQTKLRSNELRSQAVHVHVLWISQVIVEAQTKLRSNELGSQGVHVHARHIIFLSSRQSEDML